MNWIKGFTCASLFAALLTSGCDQPAGKASGTDDSTGTASAEKKDELFTRFNLDKVKLPPGFSMSVYAIVPNARSMCWGTNGTLFVGNRNGTLEGNKAVKYEPFVGLRIQENRE